MVLGRLRATLFASKLHVAATVAVGLVLLGVLAFVLGVIGAPTVAGVDSRFADVNETATTVESDLVVENPNPVGVQLGGTTVEYAISMNGIRMAEGTREGIAVERGTSTIDLTTYLDNGRIPEWWGSHVSNGERTTVAVHADGHSSLLGASFGAPTIEEEIETDVTAAMNSTETRPIDADLPLVSDPVVYVNETSGTWGNVTDEGTELEMTLTVYNPKSHPVAVSELGYDVGMNDVDVGEGSTERSIVIGPGETETIETTAVIDNEALDDWWVTHLERNQVTEMTIDFSARLDLSSFGAGSAEVPLDGTTQTIETDIFGNKDEGGTANDEASGSGESTPADDGTDQSTSGDGTTATAADGTDSSEDGTDSPSDEPGTPTATPTDSPLDDPLGAVGVPHGELALGNDGGLP